MIFSPSKHFLSFSNKQKLDKNKKIFRLPTLIFFGMLAETRVFFLSRIIIKGLERDGGLNCSRSLSSLSLSLC